MAALRAVRTEIERLGDLPALLAPLADEGLPENDEARSVLREPGARAVLGEARAALSQADPWTAGACRDALARAGRAAGARGRALYMPVRVALTGRMHGPELPLVLEAMGRERALERLERASLADA
jgi:nondiscriminating glutamyl-tRNA synthetase